ncbi:MAG: hypothetical protein Q7R80_02755 [bacterium]|nr:hypothetical protein [bacterium]
MYERFEHCYDWVERFRKRFPPPPVPMHGGHGGTSMALDGFGASIVLAPRLRGEGTHPLPSGVPTLAYPVAPYEGAPRGWRRTRDAFFVPIPLGSDGKGPGMWYDWTMNVGHTHHVAVVPSTTGLNPIVGRKADKLRLEQYKECCPIHNTPFEGDRFCATCNYQHPPQNYVAAPNTLWWDGFRRADGTVEQFAFSDKILERDVGVAILGKDRVPAFGFAFFRSKDAKPVPVHVARRSAGPMPDGGTPWNGPPSGVYAGGPIPVMHVGLGAPSASALAGGSVPWDDSNCAAGAGPEEIASLEKADGEAVAVAACMFVGTGAAPDLPPIGAMGSASMPEPFDDREVVQPPPVGASLGEIRAAAIERAVAVGRGAKIDQKLEPDSRSLSEWQDEASAVITVYFVPEEVAVAILEGPQRDLVGDPAGYLRDVGVPAGTE